MWLRPTSGEAGAARGRDARLLDRKKADHETTSQDNVHELAGTKYMLRLKPIGIARTKGHHKVFANLF